MRDHIADFYPLSPMQQGMLFHALESPESTVHHEFLRCELEGKLAEDTLEYALQAVVDRHAVLRSAFLWEGLREPVQVVHRDVPLPLQRLDLSGITASEQERRLTVLAQEERESHFELSQPPLLRMTLVKLGLHRSLLLWSFHHMLLDGWSTAQVLQEFFELYEIGCRNTEPQLPPAVPYRNYIAWLKRQSMTRAEAFWRQRLAGFSRPTPLPLALPRARRAEGVEECRLSIDSATSDQLKSLASRLKLTPNTVVQAAWARLLALYSGELDILFGAVVSGRPPELSGIESLVGLMINTLPVRIAVPKQTAIETWMRELQTLRAEESEFEFTPLYRIQEWAGVAGSPLFETLLGYQNYPFDSVAAQPSSGLRLVAVDAIEQTNVPLTLTIGLGQEMGLRALLDPRRFDLHAVDRVLRSLATLLRNIVANPDAPVQSLGFLSAEERQQVLTGCNLTPQPYPRQAGLAELFADQVARHPEAVALEFGDGLLSYAELDRQARCLATNLGASGVSHGSLVGLCLERSTALAVGILGILQAGGAYVPLDPDHPSERLDFMAEDAGLAAVVTEEAHAAALPHWGLPTLVLTTGTNANLAKEITATPNVVVSGESLAYVIYTSGSTGRPKGVAVPQRAVARLALGTDYVDLRPGNRMAQASTASFDAATFEIWGALLTGGRLVGLERELTLAPAELAAALDRHRIDTLFLTTALFNQVVRLEPAAFARLRELLFGGEAVDPDIVRRVLAEGSPRRLLHVYGPTESTTFATWHEVDCGADTDATIPIGRPLANTTAYVLDSNSEPVPVNVPGELYLGADGLARGYLHRPALTAECFVPHPFADSERLYRTGDRVHRGADGAIEFLGRFDHQIKLRGFRIELGEIEEALRGHPAIGDAVVVLTNSLPVGEQLVAYAVPTSPNALPIAELRNFLGERLPHYMVPQLFVSLPELPLNANGKLDRDALPKPIPAEVYGSVSTSELPATAVEATLAEIWADVLGCSQVGRSEDFFDLGGHSLLAIQLISRARRAFGIDLPLSALFENSTVERLATVVQRAIATGPEAPPIERITRDAPLPLSFGQQRLWFLHQLLPMTDQYNVPANLRLTGRLVAPVLSACLDEIVRRHEVMRTRFVEADGVPVQIIDEPRGLPLPTIDLSGLPEAERSSTLARLQRNESLQAFDLVAGPVVRALLVRLQKKDHALLLSMHHAVADLWSMAVLMGELAKLYTAFVAGLPSPLEELPVQYADYAVWQRRQMEGEAWQEQIRYWRKRLERTPPALELPADRPRPAVQSFRGALESIRWPGDRRDAARRLSRSQDATLYMTLLACFQILLARYSGTRDVCVGSPILNRTRPEIEPLIGFFVNTVVLRTDLSNAPRFREVLAQVRRLALEAYANPDVPFEQIVEEIQPERTLTFTPLFQVMFVLHNAGAGRITLPGLEATPLPNATETAKFDLTLIVQEETEAGFVATVEYNTDLFDRTTIVRMLGHLERLLMSAAAEPNRRVSALPALALSECHQLLTEWSGPAADGLSADLHADEVGIDRLFAHQATVSPDRIALVSAGDAWTYGDLAARSHGLAQLLEELARSTSTNSREVLVGMIAEQGPDIVVGILGILRSPCALVPVSPAYPEERIRFIVDECGIEVLVTQSHHLEKLLNLASSTPTLRHVVCLDAEPEASLAAASLAVYGPAAWRYRDSEGGAAGATAKRLAYVIYTSGSPGRPKGVPISHANLIPLLLWGRDCFGIDEHTRVASSLSCWFDFGLFEILSTLLFGGQLHLLRSQESGDPALYAPWIAERRLNTLHGTPSFVREITAAASQPLAELEILHMGGEALARADVDRLFEAVGERCLLYNGYGPTEASVNSAIFNIGSLAERHDSADANTPIGGASTGKRLYVLDRWQSPTPVGVAGELHIGGGGLSRGYWRRPSLTAERFWPDPNGSAPGARLYRTGDRVRWRASSNIEFLGRFDHQIKLRGFRIELGEIEAALIEHPEINASTALLREDRPGERRLVAYIVAQFEPPPSTEELRSFLAEILPWYMVPSVFMNLATLPLTPTGKVDRRALPPPAQGEEESKSYEPPSTPTEETVAGIWSEVLGREQVGRQANFFDLGGHSLLATQVISRVRQAFDVNLQLRALFEAVDLARFAERIDLARLEEVPEGGDAMVSPARFQAEVESAQRRLDSDPNIEEILPLAPGPRALVAQTLASDRPSTWMMQLTYGLAAPLEERLLGAAWGAILQRYALLRSVVAWRGLEQPVQVIRRDLEMPVRWLDWTALNEAEQNDELQRLLHRDREAGLDFSAGPLLRLVAIRRRRDAHDLVLSFHHLLLDGWSNTMLLHDLLATYEALRTGRGPATLPAIVPYQTYLDWLERKNLAPAEAYWRQTLGGFTAPPPLPIDPMVTPGVEGQEEIQVFLDKALSRRLEIFAQRHRLTINTLAQGVWSLVLSSLADCEELVLGVVTWGRPPDLERAESIFGCLMTTLPFRTRFILDQQIVPWLQELQIDLAALREYEHCSAEQIKQWAGWPTDAPLYDFQFVCNNFPPPEADPTNLGFEITSSEVFEENRYLLDLEVIPATRWRLALLFQRSHFNRRAARSLLGRYEAVLEQLVADPELLLASLRSPIPSLDQPEKIAATTEMTRSGTPAVELER